MKALFRSFAPLILVLSAVSPSANAQAARQALLAEDGFYADWSCAKEGGGSETGRSVVVFKEEDAKVIVNVNNFARGTCKSDVAVSESGATWNGCRGVPLQMTYDGSDPSMPFKGAGGRCTYQFKRK